MSCGPLESNLGTANDHAGEQVHHDGYDEEHHAEAYERRSIGARRLAEVPDDHCRHGVTGGEEIRHHLSRSTDGKGDCNRLSHGTTEPEHHGTDQAAETVREDRTLDHLPLGRTQSER